MFLVFQSSIKYLADPMTESKGKGKGSHHPRHRRGPRNPPPSGRPDSPETWRPVERTKSPPSGGEADTQTRIVNANLSLPWMQDGVMKSDSRKLLDNLVKQDASISTTAWVPMVDLSADQPPVSQGSVLGGSRCFMKKNEVLVEENGPCTLFYWIDTG